MLVMVARTCTSEMSRLIFVTWSCCRVESVLRPRMSGCVYCADQFGLYCGSYSELRLVVVCLTLFNATVKPPPPQGTLWTRPPLYVAWPLLIPAPTVWLPAIVVVAGSV